MRAAVLPFRSSVATLPGTATWSLLEICRAGFPAEPLGILLVDGATGRLTLRLRDDPDFEDLDEQDADILSALAADLERRGAEEGGAALLGFLEDSLSGFLRIGDRTAIAYSGDAFRTMNRLFEEHVDGNIRPYVTHLPLYGLRAAATRFGEEFDPAVTANAEAWIRAPRGIRVSEGMFVAQVMGRSMEPVIPDGSYCVFHAQVTGSRQGKRLLIEQTGGGAMDVDSRYTVKRYTSRKVFDADGWQHAGIRLEPLNPEFEAFDLGEGEFRVIGEFVQVLTS